MGRVTNTDKLQRGAIVLVGADTYYVTNIFPVGFSGFWGFIWDYNTKAWGGMRAVSVLPPTYAAYDITNEQLFPGLTAPDISVTKSASNITCYTARDGYDGVVETVHERRADGSCACGEHRPQQH